MPALSDIHIRRAVAADADRIAAFNVALAQESEGRVLEAATVRAGVRRLLAEPALGVYWLAEHSGRCLGQLLITPEWSDWRNGTFWWIQSVYVVPQARGQGVYARLHRHVEETARQTPGVCGLRLYVDRQNVKARQVYQHLGMLPTNYGLLEADWHAPGAAAAAAGAVPGQAERGRPRPGSPDQSEGGSAPALDRDLYCLSCGYNLRGLSGDPVRCPECAYLNPLGDVEIPADLIAQQLRKMESAPAYAVGCALGVFATFAPSVIVAADLPSFVLAPLAMAVAWPLLVARFRKSCLGKPGWVSALARYHFWGLLMIGSTIGGPPAVLFAVYRGVERFTAGADWPLVATSIALLGLVVAVPFWVRILYRRAKAPLEPLQREVAATLAREAIRRHMARAPRRSMFG